MASVEPYGKGFRVRWYDDGVQKSSETFRLKRDALAYKAEIEHSKVTGSYIDPALAKITVGSFGQTWLAGKAKIGVRTREKYDSALRNQILPRWGKVPIGAVALEDVQVWITKMVESGLSPSAISTAKIVLGSIMGYAVKTRKITRNPVTGVELPEPKSRPHHYLTHAEVADLCDAYPERRLTVETYAYTGLRWSELAGVRVRDTNMLTKRLTVTGKGDRRRVVPIPSFLLDAIAAQCAGKDGGDYLFDLDGGSHAARQKFGNGFHRAAKSIGHPELVPHDLRHTAASLAISAGGNVKAVQLMLGHKDARVTLNVYADLFDSDLDRLEEQIATQRAAANEDRRKYQMSIGPTVVPLTQREA